MSFELDDATYMSTDRRLSHAWDYQQHCRVPAKLSWKQILSVSFHWRCLTLTTLLIVCFCLLTWCRVPVDHVLPCRNGVIWVPTSITIIFYILYLVECFHCKLHRDLVNIVHTDTFQLLVGKWIKAKPVIRWKAVCYHYGRTFRQRYTRSGASGSTVPCLQYTRVNSEISEYRYQPNDCGYLDKSTPLSRYKRYDIIKVEMEKSFSFGCSCSEAAYLTQRKVFYERQVSVDDFIELNEMFYLSGSNVPDSLCLVNTSSGRLPWYCWKSVFWVMSVLCLSWPIRLLVERKTAYVSLILHKEFGGQCSGVLATSGPHSISSYDSKYSDNIYGVIPSYSEALFMSSYTLNGTRVSTTSPSNKKIISRPGTYETIKYTNDELLHANFRDSTKSAEVHKTRHQKMFSSKTSDDLGLLRTHFIASGYQCSKPVPRSVSLHVPAAGQSSRSKANKETNLPAPSLPFYGSRHVIGPLNTTPKSKTMCETANLL